MGALALLLAVKAPALANPVAMRLCVEGKRLYVAAGTGVFVFDVSEPRRPKKVGFVPAFLACDVVAKGRTLFVACLYNGLRVFDASDPARPREIAAVPRNARRLALEGNILYLTSGERLPEDVWGGGKANLDVVDVSDPEKPRRLGTVKLSGMLYGVAVRDGLCFVANDKNGLAIVDASNPRAPKVVGRLPLPGRWAYSCTFDEKGRLLAGCVTGGVAVVDVSNLKSPKVLGSALGCAYGFARKGNVLFVASPCSLVALDISDPKKPTELGKAEFPGNAFDVALCGDVAYVANSSYGVRVFDVSDPKSPREAGLLDLGGLDPHEVMRMPVRQLPPKALPLRVRGKAVVDNLGRPYRLVAMGLTLSNLLWCEPAQKYKFGDIEGICSYLRSLGVNAIRLAVHSGTDYRHMVVPGPAARYPSIGEFVEREVVPLVKRIEACGMLVVIDAHGVRAAYDGLYSLFGWWLPFWREVAKRLHDDPYIAWFELWQEPGFYPREVRDERIRRECRRRHVPGQRLYYMQTIRDIRKVDKTHIVMVEDYGPWWWVAEEQWAAVNFKVDPGYDNAIFAKRAAYDNGFSESFRRYVEGLMDKWEVPVCLAEIETGHRYNKPEDWFYFVYGWLANEERTIPLQFWAVSELETMMADVWAPFVKRWASPPPPPKKLPEPRVLARATLLARDAEGGRTVRLTDRGRKVVARFIPPEAEPGAAYTFKLPRPLPAGRYRVRVRLYCDGKPAHPQAIVYFDKKGRQYPPDSAINWGEDHYYFVNHHIVPLFLYARGWVEWRTTWDTLAEMVAVQIRKVKGVPYLDKFERPDLPTRPVSRIAIERLGE